MGKFGNGIGRRWQWIAAVWFGVGLFDATQTVFSMRSAGMHHSWIRLFFTLLLTWVPFAVFTPTVLRLGRDFPVAPPNPINWLVHLAACAAICALGCGWRSGFEIALNPWALTPGPDSFWRMWLSKFDGDFLGYLILYSSILAISYVLASREMLARQETETVRLSEQLSRAQLHILRQQIEPHFLFNALNSIAGLVRERRNDDAVSMIAGLSDFLRGVLKNSGRQEVALKEEIDFLQKYLDIQKVRFSDRLQFSIEMPDDLSDAKVPNLLLQPIVENAIKHGISKVAQGGRVGVAIHRSNGSLRIYVSNDGPSLQPDWATSQSGIGILNLRARLKSLYGEDGDFALLDRAAGGVEAVVTLPYATATAKDERS